MEKEEEGEMAFTEPVGYKVEGVWGVVGQAGGRRGGGKMGCG